MPAPDSVVVIGAGPAGLTAAHALLEHGVRPLVLEASDAIGGLARTEVYKGYRFDIGGHRFYTKVAEVQQLWADMLGPDLRRVRRRSSIFYRGRFFRYPLDFVDALVNLGPIESVAVLLSYVKTCLRPRAEEKTFEDWVTNRFGQRLYEAFFRSYTEKVWGMPCREIQADWAAQRIQGLSLTKSLTNAVFGSNGLRTLINEFHYPVLGPGMMWQRFREAIEQRGGEVWTGAEVVRLARDAEGVQRLTVRRDGQLVEIAAGRVISTMPLGTLVKYLDPGPPAEVLDAATSLVYRGIIVVGLIVNRPHLFADQWIYIHSPDVQVARVQNFKNWSPAMVPDAGKTSLGLEYFCTEGDTVWQWSDAALAAHATREIERLGLVSPGDVEDSVVFRQSHAYPVYDAGYRRRIDRIRQFLATVPNLHTIGRNGLHRYNNQDHSMLTAMLAVKTMFGERHDVWDVNTERSYYEEFAVTPSITGTNPARWVPPLRSSS